MASSRRIIVFLLFLGLRGFSFTKTKDTMRIVEIRDGSRCPDGWTRFEGKCYQHQCTSVTGYREAQHTCFLLGGKMAVPDSDSENTTVCVGQADVVFVLDSSGSVKAADFQLLLSFVSDVIRDWDVGQDKFRVGVMTFSDTSLIQFHLDSFNDKNQMLAAIANIKYSKGGTKTGVALKLLKDTMFTSNNGDRPSVPNIGIIITDGQSNHPGNTKVQATAPRNAGITLMSVGVGAGANTAELNEMATDPDSSHVFTVDDFSKLAQIKSVIQQQTCSGVGPAVCVGQADVVFVLDSSRSVNSGNFQLLLSFVSDVIRDWDVGQDRFRVGVLRFASTSVTQFHLNAFSDKNQMLAAIANIKYKAGGTKTGVALKHLKDTMFTSNNGDRPSVPNIGIIITDGQSNHPGNTKVQATAARNAGITLMSVGVGAGANTAELNEMATDPDSSHVFTVDDFSKLAQIKSVIQQQTCSGVGPALPSKPTCAEAAPLCVGEWTVILRRESDLVNFNQDWSHYVNGFGSITGNFWMGLEKIHQLTSQGKYDLRVELKDWDDVTARAYYEGFYVGPGSDFYRLRFDRFTGGTAGDGLWSSDSYHYNANNTQFTTKNADRDTWRGGNCAKYYQSGWWFKSCKKANLCGIYYNKAKVAKSMGIQWQPWKGWYYSLKYASMMIKPVFLPQ